MTDKTTNPAYSPDPFANDEMHSAVGGNKKKIPNILVVDDARSIRKIISRALRNMGLTNISEADDGLVALPIIHNQDVDLLICDLCLPEMSGIDLLRVVRADQRLQSLPVLIISADTMRETIVEVASLGVSGYLIKPFTVGAFQQKIRSIFYG